uniref:Uncharacterized protein n=1 Tax=Anguilla anguilla TaxID=7936 RepID=A0A0E9QGJ6_ANGAN
MKLNEYGIWYHKCVLFYTYDEKS